MKKQSNPPASKKPIRSCDSIFIQFGRRAFNFFRISCQSYLYLRICPLYISISSFVICLRRTLQKRISRSYQYWNFSTKAYLNTSASNIPFGLRLHWNLYKTLLFSLPPHSQRLLLHLLNIYANTPKIQHHHIK